MSSEKYIPPYKVSEEAVNLIAEISAAVERFDIEISGVKGVRLVFTQREHLRALDCGAVLRFGQEERLHGLYLQSVRS